LMRDGNTRLKYYETLLLATSKGRASNPCTFFLALPGLSAN